MRIGILTFHDAHNCGTLLQCYALRAYLQSRYACVDVINYSPDILTRRYALCPYYPYRKTVGEFRHALKGFALNLCDLPAYKHRSQRVRRFVSEYLGVSGRKLKSADALQALEYDCYLMGSDQIWNPDITLGMDRAFYGDFARPASSRCVAYAASLGRDRLRDEHLDAFQRYIANFSAISMRESSAIPFVQKYASCPVSAAGDPVFLFTGEQWRALAQAAEARVKDRYLLVYYTEYNAALFESAEKTAREKALPLVVLNRNVARGSKQHSYLAGIGPLEFLSYIAHAEYVVTNSFHATAFSALLHRQFTAFTHSTVGTRITDLLGSLGLSGQLAQDSEAGTSSLDPLQWEEVDAAIEDIRKASALFLQESIGV